MAKRESMYLVEVHDGASKPVRVPIERHTVFGQKRTVN
jgi:hypothetical protein